MTVRAAVACSTDYANDDRESVICSRLFHWYSIGANVGKHSLASVLKSYSERIKTQKNSYIVISFEKVMTL